MTNTKKPQNKENKQKKPATTQQIVEVFKAIGFKKENIENLMLNSPAMKDTETLMSLAAVHSMLHMDEFMNKEEEEVLENSDEDNE